MERQKTALANKIQEKSYRKSLTMYEHLVTALFMESG